METKFAEIPDALWEQVEALLPPIPKGPGRGRPRIPSRTILAGIVYRLRTGAQWKALPTQFGSGSTCHARFQAWSEAGIFRRLFEKLVELYDEICGIEWEWASMGSRLHSRTTPAPNTSSRVAMFSPFIRANYASA